MKALSTPASPSMAATVKHINLRGSELAKFRTKICEQHRSKSCLSADCCADSHCQTWQRRNPNEYIYSSKLCPDIEFIKKGSKMSLVRRCSRGRRCTFAHSKEEELYHPNMYKTRLCNSHPRCTRYYCPFAHNEEELRKPPITTVSPPSSPTTSRLRCSVLQSWCPPSPVSASTTASSTAASPFLSSFSPIPNTTKAPSDDETQQRRSATAALTSSLVEDRQISIDSTEGVGLEPLVIPQTQLIIDHLCNVLWGKQTTIGESEGSYGRQLTSEDAEIYSNILIHILQKEGLTPHEKMFLERSKLGDESAATLVPCDSGVTNSTYPPPGLSGFFNAGDEAAVASDRRNLHYYTQKSYCHDTSRNYSHYPHNSSWDPHSNISATMISYYGDRHVDLPNRNRPIETLNSDGVYPCGSLSRCQFSSNRILNGGHYQHYHRFPESGRLHNNLAKPDFGGRNYKDKNDRIVQGSLTPEFSVNGSDPLVLLPAFSLLNSVTSKESNDLTASDSLSNDNTALLIAEILKQLSQSNPDDPIKETPEETHGESNNLEEANGKRGRLGEIDADTYVEETFGESNRLNTNDSA